MQIENFKNNLIKVKIDLTEKFKKNNRVKKAGKDYYEYENDKFYGLKDIKNLFDQNDDDHVYEDIESLFNESIILYEMKQNGLEYAEIKKLMSIQSSKGKCKYVSFLHGRIEQKNAIEYEGNYCEVNYYECEHKKEVYCIESKPCLIDSEYIICEIIEDQNVECC